MTASVFDHLDYKAFLKAWLRALPGHGRGQKTRIAQALRCHTAYVTQVFEGDADFSSEQALELSAYLGHSAEETRFFLLLVQRARAGTAGLRQHLDQEIRKVLDARLNLKNRLIYEKRLSESHQSTYYSTWLHSAIYAMVSISAYQRGTRIADALGIPQAKVNEVIRFLVTTGLVVEEGGKFKVGTTSIHLASDSPMIQKHHVNWRMKAIQSLDLPQPTDVHYSSVVSLARADAPKVRAILVRAIEEIRAVVKESPEEKVLAYTLDLFEIA